MKLAEVKITVDTASQPTFPPKSVAHIQLDPSLDLGAFPDELEAE